MKLMMKKQLPGSRSVLSTRRGEPGAVLEGSWKGSEENSSGERRRLRFVPCRDVLEYRPFQAVKAGVGLDSRSVSWFHNMQIGSLYPCQCPEIVEYLVRRAHPSEPVKPVFQGLGPTKVGHRSRIQPPNTIRVFALPDPETIGFVC